MVRKIVLSEYSSDPPDGSGRVKIPTKDGQPLYSLERVQALVKDEQRLSLWTRKCVQDVHNLFDSDLERVAELIQGLRKDDYIDSEWCGNGKGAWAACDAYRIRRLETIPVTGKSRTVEYFVKFAVNKIGQLVLLVSCHL
jgi:hypothetical protein